MSQQWDDELEDDEPEYEEYEEYEERPVVRRGRRRPSPPRHEAFALFYCVLALTFVHYHGAIRTLADPWPLFSWFLINFLVLFGVPAVIIRHRWRLSLERFGLRWGDFAIWSRYFIAYFAVMLPVVLLVSRSPEFQAYYPRCGPARESLGWLLFAALGWLVYFFAWEWFFRGFMLFSLAPRYGGAIAILIQTIPFVMMHYPKPEMEAWSSIIAGIALGLMAFRGRSFIGAWLLHWSVAFMMDVVVIAWPA